MLGVVTRDLTTEFEYAVVDFLGRDDDLTEVVLSPKGGEVIGRLATHAWPAYLLLLLQRQVLVPSRESTPAAQLHRDDVATHDADRPLDFVGTRRMAAVTLVGTAQLRA